MTPKSMKNPSKNDTNKMIENWIQKSHVSVRRCMRVYAKTGGLVPYNQSIRPTISALQQWALYHSTSCHKGTVADEIALRAIFTTVPGDELNLSKDRPKNLSKTDQTSALKTLSEGSWRLLGGSWRALGGLLGLSWPILAGRPSKRALRENCETTFGGVLGPQIHQSPT